MVCGHDPTRVELTVSQGLVEFTELSHGGHTARREASLTSPPMETYVVRLWLPDRPGALGQVASRIGAVRGDVIGIDILERGGGQAVDELVVGLPDGTPVDVMLSEIKQVDGVGVEDIRQVPNGRPDAGIVSLEIAARLAETTKDERLAALCAELVELVEGSWAVAAHVGDASVLVSLGEAPDIGWLAAFIEGSSHLGEAEHHDAAPGDLAWALLPTSGLAVAVGRSRRPFHTRERQQVALLGRITDALLA